MLYGDQVHAWALDLPGCMTAGADRAETGRMIPLALEEHAAWLRGHGEDLPVPHAWDVVESVDASSDPSLDVCFAAESERVDDESVTCFVRRIEFARADLLAAFESLPPAMRNWAPPDETVRHRDPWAREPRSARDIVTHVLQLEVYYCDGLRDGAARGIFEDVTSPADGRARTIHVMHHLPVRERARIFAPLRPRARAPERWTLRKVVRRIISHERAHAAELAERRTWAYLGPPRPGARA